MTKFPAVLAAVVLGAAGFTAAAIASGSGVMGVLDTTTTTTATDTTTTTATSGGAHAKVALCHHTGSKHHPQQTITVAQPAVKAHLKHHDELGACPATSTTSASGPKHGGHETTTTATTTGTSTIADDDTSESHGKGHGKGHGKP